MLLKDADLEGKYWADDYRKWHATQEVPPSLDKELVNRLSSKGWEQEYDAAAELYTRSLFQSLDGLKFQFQPELQGKTPDFLLRDLSDYVVADVTVLHGGPMSEIDKQQDDYMLLTQKLMDIETDLFATEVWSMEGSRTTKGRGGGPVAFDKILRPVRAWFQKQERDFQSDPVKLRWDYSYDGTRYLSEYFRFEDLGIDLEISVKLRLRSEESDEERKVRHMLHEGGNGPSSAFIDDTEIRLGNALEEKVSYLRQFEHPQPEKGSLPYIIVIFSSDSFTPDREDIEKVLYGPSTSYDLISGPMLRDLRQWELRAGQELRSYSEGVFTNRRKDLLAVLVCKGHIAYPESCDMSMWVNPYASCFSIPQSLYQLKTYTLNREIVCTPPT